LQIDVSVPLAIIGFSGIGLMHSKLRIFNLHDGVTHIIGIGKNRLGLAAGQKRQRGKKE
jgi:hypothetical protein